jgi:hypothetical protein
MNSNSSSSCFVVTVLASLAATVMVVFGSLFGAVAGIEAYL